ncbi:MAG: hypothetical protein KAR31_06675, partial [Candidatus Omnitrophica bacterium]|nr:hypothetical protein [Candidatus Omnitrophota bacterium]
IASYAIFEKQKLLTRNDTKIWLFDSVWESRPRPVGFLDPRLKHTGMIGKSGQDESSYLIT